VTSDPRKELINAYSIFRVNIRAIVLTQFEKRQQGGHSVHATNNLYPTQNIDIKGIDAIEISVALIQLLLFIQTANQKITGPPKISSIASNRGHSIVDQNEAWGEDSTAYNSMALIGN
jgi:hypothetical protein